MRRVVVIILLCALAGCVTGGSRSNSRYSTGHLSPGPEFAKTKAIATETFDGKYFAQPLNSNRIWLKTMNITGTRGFTKRTACHIKVDNYALREGLENLSKNILAGYFKNIEFGVVGGGSFALFGDNLDGLLSVSLVQLKPKGKCTNKDGYLTCEHSVTVKFKSQYKTKIGKVKSFEVEDTASIPEQVFPDSSDACPALASLYEDNIKAAFERAVSRIAQLMGRDIINDIN